MKKRIFLLFLSIITLCLNISTYADGVTNISPKKESSKDNTNGVTDISPERDSYGNIVPEELQGFKYKINGDVISLDSYKGDKKILEIYPTYIIEGSTYRTDLRKFVASIRGDVEAVIFADGIKTIPHAIFNMSDVQKVYFPLSMEKVEDETLGYLSPKKGNDYVEIYYEGTLDQWMEVFVEYEEMTMEKAQTAEEYGAAAADWLNGLIGAGYDSSKFMYFFETKPEDLINSFK